MSAEAPGRDATKDAENGEVRQEPEHVRGALVAWLIAGATAVTLLCILVARLLLGADIPANHVATPRYPTSATVGGIEQLPFDGPSHRSAAPNGYGWVDRRHGIATIPIDRAMKWLVADARRGALGSPDEATTQDAGSAGTAATEAP